MTSHRVLTTENCISGETGNPAAVQSIDPEALGGMENRMNATPPATTLTFTGCPSDSGNTTSGNLPSAWPCELTNLGKMLRMFQLDSRKRASLTPLTSSANTDVAQSRIDVMYELPKTADGRVKRADLRDRPVVGLGPLWSAAPAPTRAPEPAEIPAAPSKHSAGI